MEFSKLEYWNPDVWRKVKTSKEKAEALFTPVFKPFLDIGIGEIDCKRLIEEAIDNYYLANEYCFGDTFTNRPFAGLSQDTCTLSISGEFEPLTFAVRVGYKWRNAEKKPLQSQAPQSIFVSLSDREGYIVKAIEVRGKMQNEYDCFI